MASKDRGSIPFPPTPSQDSLRLGGGLISGNGEEEKEKAEEAAPTNGQAAAVEA